MRTARATGLRERLPRPALVAGAVATAAGAIAVGRWGLHAAQQAIELRQPPAGPETVFLGLGGNVGDRLDTLNQAVRLLHAHLQITVEDISSVYETDPIGPSEDRFLNIAVRIATDLAPLPLLRACQEVEDRLGRVRTVRWGPRTVDVDVLLYGDRTLATPVLTIPHPEMAHRAFVLVPLVEVATGWVLPDGRSVASATAALAPIEGVDHIGRQVSLTPLPSGPPILPSGLPPDGAAGSGGEGR